MYWGATPECPGRPVWCSPAGPCSPGSGTDPGVCTCLSACSHMCQSSARSLAPVGEEQPPRDRQSAEGERRREFFGFFFKVSSGQVWKTGRKERRKEGITPTPQSPPFQYCIWRLNSACGTTQLQHMQEPVGGMVSWWTNGCSCSADGDKKQDAKKPMLRWRETRLGIKSSLSSTWRTNGGNISRTGDLDLVLFCSANIFCPLFHQCLHLFFVFFHLLR